MISLVTHKAQVLVILLTNDISYTQGDLAPSFSFYLDRVRKGVGYKDEIYKIILRATTNENLTLAINSFLKLWSNHGSGYERSEANYPEYIQMNVIWEAEEGTDAELECISRWNL